LPTALRHVKETKEEDPRVMMQYLRILCGLLLAALMTACGGGGGSPGATTVGGSPTTPTTPVTSTATASVTDFALFTNKQSINNTGAETALLTVVAVDENRNVVPGAKVTVSTDQSSTFAAVDTVTSASGTFTGNVGIGSDKSDRDITVTVTVNGIVKKTAVRVAGSKLVTAVSPSAPAPGQATTLTVTLQDSGGNAIAGVPVTLGGTIPSLQNQVITTSTSGVATRSFAAPTASGQYTITASGSGVNAGDYSLQVFSTAVPAAAIPAGAVPSLAAAPNVLAVNSPGSTANQSTLRFLFLDSANRPVQNVRVRFTDVTVGLAGVGASISTGTSTVFTDASGSVTSQYIAGQNSSPTNGVTVKACYSGSDFASTTDCPAFVTASLTVAGQALAVSVGDDNLLQRGSGTYIKQFAVTVADSAGRAVANAPVDVSVDLTHYGKGLFSYPINVVPQSLVTSYPSATTEPSPDEGRAWCANEDVNRNGSFDFEDINNGSKDSNNQPTLEPRKSDLIVSYANPAVTTTNSSGVLLIKVEYSQRMATWLAYKVRVTANVSGSQGMAERQFVTGFIEGDDENGGSFLEAPYGFSNCLSPN
jgi:hypothetical protein